VTADELTHCASCLVEFSSDEHEFGNPVNLLLRSHVVPGVCIGCAASVPMPTFADLLERLWKIPSA